MTRLPSSPEGLSPEHMRSALGRVAALLAAGEPVPSEWAKWLSEALRKIERKVKADRALGLVGPTGRRKKITPRDVARERRLEGFPAHEDEFPTLDPETNTWKEPVSPQKPTQERLAGLLSVDPRTIQRAEKEWHKQIEEERSEDPDPDYP